MAFLPLNQEKAPLSGAFLLAGRGAAIPKASRGATGGKILPAAITPKSKTL